MKIWPLSFLAEAWAPSLLSWQHLSSTRPVIPVCFVSWWTLSPYRCACYLVGTQQIHLERMNNYGQFLGKYLISPCMHCPEYPSHLYPFPRQSPIYISRTSPRSALQHSCVVSPPSVVSLLLSPHGASLLLEKSTHWVAVMQSHTFELLADGFF